jgi:cytochrome P450
MAPPDNIPILDLDPFSAETLANPLGYQAALREAGPLVWLSKYGFYAVGGYAEVAEVLADWRQYSSARGVGPTDLAKEKPWWGEQAVLIESDPPRHNEIKAQVMKIYNPRAVTELGIEFERQAEKLLDALLVSPQIDGHLDIAEPYILKVFGDALGIARDGREALVTIGEFGFNNFGPRNEILEKNRAEMEQLGAMRWMQERTEKEAVRDGSLGRQLHDLSETGELNAAESANVMRGQLAAGVDTTIAALGYLLYCFAVYPDQYQLVRQDPGLAAKAFEEAVRLFSPLQTIMRTTAADAEIGGLPIRKDHKIVVSMAAANRDSRKFANPDQFDITRKINGHVGFGRGVHSCVGMHVAILEAEKLIQSIVKRVASFSLAGKMEMKINNTMRGPSKVPLEITRAG